MKEVPKAFLIAWLLFLGLALCLAAFYQPGAGKVRDFLSFQAAGSLVLHQPGRLYDLDAQRAAEEALDPASGGALPFFHLPYEALLYAPFAFLSARTGYALSVVADLLLLLACVLTARETFERVIPVWQPRPGLAVFLFVPVYWTILQGQDSLLLLLICCLTLRALIRRQEAQAGAILALGLFKFELALPLLILLAMRRGWRLLAGFLPVCAAIVSLSAALVGRHGVAALAALLSAGSLVGDAAKPAQALMAIHPAAMPNLMGLVYAGLDASLASRSCFALVLVLSTLIMIRGAIAVRRAGSEEAAFGLAILGAVLVSYHLYLHDATLLLLSLCAVAPCSRGARWARHLLFLAPFFLVLFAPGYLFLLALPILWLFFEAAQHAMIPSPQQDGGITAAAPIRPAPETDR